MSLSIIINFISLPVAAANLCKAEFGQLTNSLENFIGDETEKRELLVEYHSKRQMLPEVCSGEQQKRIEMAASKVFGSQGLADSSSRLKYEPRKTVEIGTVDDYAVLKNK
jgi:hypothetical protein